MAEKPMFRSAFTRKLIPTSNAICSLGWAITFVAELLLAATISSAQTTDKRKQPKSPYTQECITEEKIVQENIWTAKNLFGRYKGNDAHLFAETVKILGIIIEIVIVIPILAWKWGLL